MGKMILVTGGARSGKSTFAEELVRSCGENILYIATSIPFDEEMKLRIQKHREQRPAHWETLEGYKGLDAGVSSRVDGKDAVMLDCITIMITNLMFEQPIDWDHLPAGAMTTMEEAVHEEMEKLLTAVRNCPVPFVVVTNEIGMGIVPDNVLSRLFRDIAGRMNQMLAKAADEVYLCVAGIPVKIKGNEGV